MPGERVTKALDIGRHRTPPVPLNGEPLAHLLTPVGDAHDSQRVAIGPQQRGNDRDALPGLRQREQGVRRAALEPPKLTSRLIFGDDAPERQRNSQRNLIERRTIYWMITAERPKL